MLRYSTSRLNTIRGMRAITSSNFESPSYDTSTTRVPECVYDASTTGVTPSRHQGLIFKLGTNISTPPKSSTQKCLILTRVKLVRRAFTSVYRYTSSPRHVLPPCYTPALTPRTSCETNGIMQGNSFGGKMCIQANA